MAKVWNNKGSLLGELGKLEEAIRCFDEAVKIDPQDISSLYNKGFILHKLGKQKEALKYFNQVLEIDLDFEPAKRLRKIFFFPNLKIYIITTHVHG